MKRYAIATAVLLFVVAPWRQTPQADTPRYTVEALGTSPAIENRVPQETGINASGEVVGYVIDDNTGDRRAVRYTDANGWEYLPGLVWGSDAMGVNVHGDIVGTLTVSAAGKKTRHAYRYNAATNSVRDFGTLPGGSFTEAFAINDDGYVVGDGDTTGGAQLAFRASPEPSPVVVVLPDPGGHSALPCGINNAGQIAMTIVNARGSQHAARLELNNTYTDAGTLDPTESFAFSACSTIDQLGNVGGQSLAPGFTVPGFRFDGTTMVNVVTGLPGTDGNVESLADGNAAGWFNTTVDGVSHALLYTTGNGAVDLNTQIDPASGWFLSEVKGINASGQMVGDGFLNNVHTVFRLNPASKKDTTPPVIAAHADVTAEATSANGAIVSYTAPGTTDNVDAPGTATCLPASGSAFALGATTVTCNASDAAGNAATPTTFSVNVKDTTPPVIAAHADVTADATSANGAIVSYTAPGTTDNVDAPGTATCVPASGSAFALGATTVTCNASDAAGNASAPTSFSVTVKDTTAPVIAAHADVTADATSASGATVSYAAPTTTDNVDAPGTATCSPASGSTFALGTTTVTCNAKDAAGNAAAATTFNVVVKDTTAPVIAAHADVTADATSANGASVSYTSPATSDNVDAPGTATCSPASGSTFALGTTTVTCSAKDAAGNAAAATTFNVVVKDTTAPVIAAHGDVTAEATSANGASVSYSSPATSDNVDAPGTATCSPASGSTFALGTTTVTCNAKDAAGNVAAATTFKVVVRDTTAPVIAAHGDVAAQGGPDGASVAYVASTATDAVSGSYPATCAPASGSIFPVGTTTVTCNASDAAGNVAAPTTFNVVVTLSVVKDTTPPVISMVYASPDQIWPPNGKMVPVSVMVTASDNVDPSPSCSLTSVTGGGAGGSAVTGQFTANVRSDSGAVYVLTVTCSDVSGNTSSASATVSVTKINGNSGAPKPNGKSGR